jgi:formylmethanofuran dehydrogenase subunit B
MSASPEQAGPGDKTWTCPFCPLLCDGFGLQAGSDGTLTLHGSTCPRAMAALAVQRMPSGVPAALLDGQACEHAKAMDTARRWLRESRQPLIAGLGADVAGARALYALAAATGAICDAVAGAAFAQGLRVLQDRGNFTTTLAEVRNRADVIVCIGGSPAERQPEFFSRCGLGEDLVPARHVVLLGGAEADLAALRGIGGITAEVLPQQGDLFDTVALLASAVAGHSAVPPALAALAQRLHSARYAVLVWEAWRLPAQGALLVEAINRTVGTLNRKSRAAAFPLGGGDGAATSNQVFAWLSGLPLRTRVGEHGLEHEPHVFDTQRLLDDSAVDLLLWVNAFGVSPPSRTRGQRLVLLGPPSMASHAAEPGTLFIPVATPGIGAGGHLFRTDGVVMLPLHAVRDDGLPGVATVAQQLREGLAA